MLDELDPIPGRYTLEVSSPGVERTLRTPAHFAKAVGETVVGQDPAPGARRAAAAGHAGGRRRRRASSWTVDEVRDRVAVRLAYSDIDRARTVFEWGPDTHARRQGDVQGRRPGQERAPADGDGEEEAGRNPMSKPNFEFLDALGQIARDKGISVETLLDALANALVAAYKRRPDAAEEAVVTIDPESGEIRVYGQELDEDGNVIREWDDTPDDFGRIAAQTAKQVILQRIREVERDLKYEEYAGREGDIVTGIVQQTDNRYTLLDLGKVEALLPQAEQVSYERYEHGARLKAYIVEVRKTTKGPQIVVSRSHPGLIKRLFELEVPEISSGAVEIKAAAREPGHRTKIAVWSNDPNVDPVGACVGRPRLAGADGHQRAARRAGRRGPVLRRSGRADPVGAGPGPGARGAPRRRHRHGHGHRERLPALAGHRQGGPERPAGRPADRLADRHQERDPAGRRGVGLRRRGVGRGRVGPERGRRDGLAAGRGRHRGVGHRVVAGGRRAAEDGRAPGGRRDPVADRGGRRSTAGGPAGTTAAGAPRRAGGATPRTPPADGVRRSPGRGRPAPMRAGGPGIAPTADLHRVPADPPDGRSWSGWCAPDDGSLAVGPDAAGPGGLAVPGLAGVRRPGGQAPGLQPGAAGPRSGAIGVDRLRTVLGIPTGRVGRAGLGGPGP